MKPRDPKEVTDPDGWPNPEVPTVDPDGYDEDFLEDEDYHDDFDYADIPDIEELEEDNGW